jgi:glycosyltransferase involved in cell wall biosynthesis
VDKQVSFSGRLAGPELIAAYQSAAVLIAPSRKESFGMAILEAMACGLPVVASAVDGVPQLVGDRETGFLLAPDDEGGFAGKIGELFEDPALAGRLSQAARQTAVIKYQWTDKVAETHQLLLSITGLPPKKPNPNPGASQQS